LIVSPLKNGRILAFIPAPEAIAIPRDTGERRKRLLEFNKQCIYNSLSTKQEKEQSLWTRFQQMIFSVTLLLPNPTTRNSHISG
jgi:hypothetical protein